MKNPLPDQTRVQKRRGGEQPARTAPTQLRPSGAGRIPLLGRVNWRSRRVLAGLGAIVVIAAIAVLLIVRASGGQDRNVMAHDRLTAYWHDITHGKWNQAYQMLTPANRKSESTGDFRQSFLQLLEQTGGFTEHTVWVHINGDLATAKVALTAASTPGAPFTKYQHLWWDGGDWFISDVSGGLSNNP